MKTQIQLLLAAALLAASPALGQDTLAPLDPTQADSSQSGFGGPSPGQTREYWIAADEVLWDYAPSYPTNLITGEEFTDDEKVFVEEGIGRVYLKSIYRRYTPGFQSVIERSPRELRELGLLGPILRAEVGDTIVVHFRNNSRFPATMHPHGVFYRKDSEGAPYDDGTSGADKDDDSVPPGGEHTYVWLVPPRAGPAPRDPSSIVWLYHGHAPEVASTNAGLIGAMVITAQGRARPDGTPQDVDRELFTLFTVFNENVSSYLDDNLQLCTSGPCDPDDEDFEESNLMHSMNGFVYGNNQYSMRTNESVRWYVMAMGTEVDLHTPHWHGSTLIQNGSRVDVTELLPASTRTLDLRPDDPGKWMYHCHVNDHIEAGMLALYTVRTR